MTMRVSGNFRVGARASAAGSTANPTRNVNTFALIPEMTTTITTSGGDVIFSGYVTLSVQNADNAEVTAVVDGSEFSTSARSRNSLTGLLGGTNVQTANVDILITGLAAGSHTFELHYRAVAGTARADSTYRRLYVLEVF